MIYKELFKFQVRWWDFRKINLVRQRNFPHIPSLVITLQENRFPISKRKSPRIRIDKFYPPTKLVFIRASKIRKNPANENFPNLPTRASKAAKPSWSLMQFGTELPIHCGLPPAVGAVPPSLTRLAPEPRNRIAVPIRRTIVANSLDGHTSQGNQ